MDIEEARKVLWLKNNPRPLGELLDEGYLTQERLQWAAQWAYNSKLKQAAQVLLETPRASISEVDEKPKAQSELDSNQQKPIGITLDQARKVVWPFTPYKGQSMGVLVESKQLTLKDLGYAAESAWDEKVRQAAIALALVRLDQAVKEPAPSAGFVHVVSGGRSYAERRETILTLLQGAIFGWILVAALYALSKSIIKGGQPNPDAKSISEIASAPGGILALVLVFGSIIFMVWFVNFGIDRITNKIDKEIEQYRLGQEGEDKTVQQIIQALDGNWHLFRNISLPGQNKADLDLVLVGPPGMWALEVKNFHGEYRNIGENWDIKRGNKWKAAFKSPSTQAFNNAVRLGNFLKADHAKAFVNPVVVWANEESSLFVENPSVAVWSYNRLLDELGNIWQGERLSKAERDKIVEKLTKLSEAQKKST